MKSKLLRILPISLFVIPFLAYFYFAVRANLDLSMGRYALFMDERITFDGVRAILQPANVQSFFFAITDGGDNRYGRILWTAMAAFSWIPELVFGEQGQIIAGRIWQTLLISASVVLLSLAVLRTWLSRILFAVVALCIPFGAYYSTMPKPEPLQLFFMSLFVFFAFRKPDSLLGKHWIFLGLAFGAKIATLPALVVFSAVALIMDRSVDKARKAHVSILATVLGLGLAVPLLLPASIFICLLGLAYQALDKANKFKLTNYLIADVTLLLVFLLIFKGNTDTWIQSTFLSTTHGADQESVNFASWWEYLNSEWISKWPALSLTFAFVSVLLFLAPLLLINGKKLNFIKQNLSAYTLVLAGTALNAAIMISAHRLWGFYLYPGFFLQIIAMFILMERFIRPELELNLGSKTLLRALAGIQTVLLAALLLISWAPSASAEYSKAWGRTQTQEFKLENESYLALEQFLNEFGKNSDRKISAVITPTIFHRESDEVFEVIEFWGPYSYWETATDLLVLSKNNVPGGEPYAMDSPEYERYLQEQEGYPKHVSEDGNCEVAPCFKKALTLANGAQILVRTK